MAKDHETTDSVTRMQGVNSDLLRRAWKVSDNRRVRNLIRRSLGDCVVDYAGLRLHLHPADNNTEFQIWRRGSPFEEASIRKLCELVEGRDVLVADVGANAGIFSLRLAQAAGPGALVHAFEPNPIMRERLERNISLNGIGTITVHSSAIGDVPGRAFLRIANDQNHGEGHLSENGEDGFAVEVVTLRDAVPGQIDVLKVDVEGHEDKVILPLMERPENERPLHIYLEVKHGGGWKDDLISGLESSGYAVTADFNANRLYSLEGVSA